MKSEHLLSFWDRQVSSPVHLRSGKLSSGLAGITHQRSLHTFAQLPNKNTSALNFSESTFNCYCSSQMSCLEKSQHCMIILDVCFFQLVISQKLITILMCSSKTIYNGSWQTFLPPNSILLCQVTGSSPSVFKGWKMVPRKQTYSERWDQALGLLRLTFSA